MRRPFPLPARDAARLWLVLALFALKALVPPGFMPATQQSGTLIQLCSAAGPVWVAGPARHSDAPDERHAAQAAACPMGAMLAAVALRRKKELAATLERGEALWDSQWIHPPAR